MVEEEEDQSISQPSRSADRETDIYVYCQSIFQIEFVCRLKYYFFILFIFFILLFLAIAVVVGNVKGNETMRKGEGTRDFRGINLNLLLSSSFFNGQ